MTFTKIYSISKYEFVCYHKKTKNKSWSARNNEKLYFRYFEAILETNVCISTHLKSADPSLAGGTAF